MVFGFLIAARSSVVSASVMFWVTVLSVAALGIGPLL